MLQLAEELRDMGVRNYVLQEFRPQGCADEKVRFYPAEEFLDETLCSDIGAMFESFSVRRQ